MADWGPSALRVDAEVPASGRARDMLERLEQVRALAAANAASLDVCGAFPHDEFTQLAEAGLLLAPLPPRHGGLGAGTTAEGAGILARILSTLGYASLPLGRLYEGHVNALALIVRYGTAPQISRAADEAGEGHVFGVWNTEGEAPLRLVEKVDGFVLRGGKTFASGAGSITRPLVTARGDGGIVMIAPRIASEELVSRADLSGWTATGMRASATGSFDFSGVLLGREDLIGAAGDYHRQPAFSAGAWRFCAVQLGGMARLLDEARRHLKGAERDRDPHQLARLGQSAIAVETARLWVARAAEKAEAHNANEEAAAYVSLARCALERCGLEVLEHVNRSVGLAGFLAPHPIERVSRDLATYLRQPAPDGALAAGAGHVRDFGLSLKDAWA